MPCLAARYCIIQCSEMWCVYIFSIRFRDPSHVIMVDGRLVITIFLTKCAPWSQVVSQNISGKIKVTYEALIESSWTHQRSNKGMWTKQPSTDKRRISQWAGKERRIEEKSGCEIKLGKGKKRLAYKQQHDMGIKSVKIFFFYFAECANETLLACRRKKIDLSS